MKRPAVFIDRDGTISEEVGYVNHPSRFRLFPYSAEAIRILNNNGWLAIVITNQAGVARGYFSEDVIVSVHDQLKRDLQKDRRSSMRFTTARIIRQSASRRIDSTATAANQKPG